MSVDSVLCIGLIESSGRGLSDCTVAIPLQPFIMITYVQHKL